MRSTVDKIPVDYSMSRPINRKNKKGRSNNMVSKPFLHNALKGKTFIPPSQPRMTNVSPWWPVRCSIGAQGDKTIACSTIANTFKDQFGLYKTDSQHRIDIALRFQKVVVYNLNVTRPISVCVHSTAGTGFTAVLEDWPSQTRFARVGFQWPIADSTFILNDTSSTPIIRVDTSGNDAWLAQINILWRPTVQSSITSRFSMFGFTNITEQDLTADKTEQETSVQKLECQPHQSLESTNLSDDQEESLSDSFVTNCRV